MIRLNDLTIGYGHRILLQHASATIPAGELVALVGRNGTGKSTLLRAIAGFGERLGGEIRLDGHSLETLSPQQLATTVSFVTTERVRIPNLRCEDVVALGRAPYTNWIGRVQEQDKAIVERSLDPKQSQSYIVNRLIVNPLIGVVLSTSHSPSLPD